MNEDTRLREGLDACASPSGSVAATAANGVYAALDLGTNNCRLLIASPAGDSFRVVDSFSRIIRLGEGISATGSISEAAIERAIGALSICSDKIRYRKAKRLRLAEHFGGRDVTAESYERMVREVAQHVAPFAAEHGTDLRDMHMLGTSGTVTTLAGVHLNLSRYDRRRIDGIWMNSSDVSAVIQRLLGMSYQERANNNCISVERADLVLAGCAILDAIRDAFPLPRLRVADRGLREGMLVEMMREDGALRPC
jgi:exopolyphosphatase/pppGpp-phosphohydrolase